MIYPVAVLRDRTRDAARRRGLELGRLGAGEWGLAFHRVRRPGYRKTTWFLFKWTLTWERRS